MAEAIITFMRSSTATPPGFDLRDAVVNAALLSRQDTDVADTAHDGRNRSPLNGFARVERQLGGRMC